jgi:hypothetical protein
MIVSKTPGMNLFQVVCCHSLHHVSVAHHVEPHAAFKVYVMLDQLLTRHSMCDHEYVFDVFV